MLTIVLIIVLVLLLGGGGFAWGPGWRGGHGNMLGILLTVLFVLVLVWLIFGLAGGGVAVG